MKQSLAGILGARMLEGPTGVGTRVPINIDKQELELMIGVKRHRFSLENVDAFVDEGNLALLINEDRYTFQMKNPEKAAERINSARINKPVTAEDSPIDVVVKKYKNEKEYTRDAQKMAAAGYVPQGQLQHKGKTNVGRTVGKAVIFLPWAIMRPSKKADSVTVTWVKHSTEPVTMEKPNDDIASKLRKIAELRDEGILTEEEFETKKADLLSQM